MAKNDRFVVRHDEGWAVKKTRAGRSSSVHATQKEAEKRAKELSIIWEERSPYPGQRWLFQGFRHNGTR